MGKRSVFTKPSHNALDNDCNYNNVSFLFFFFFSTISLLLKKKENNSLRLLLELKKEPAVPGVALLISSPNSNPSKQHTPSQNGNFHKRWRTELLLTGSLESFSKAQMKEREACFLTNLFLLSSFFLIVALHQLQMDSKISQPSQTLGMPGTPLSFVGSSLLPAKGISHSLLACTLIEISKTVFVEKAPMITVNELIFHF